MTDVAAQNVAAAKAALVRRQNVAAAKAALEARQAPKADMSFTGRLKDNLIGVDDGVMSTGEKVAAALNKGGESLTLGLVGDEAAAGFDAAIGRGTYEDRLAAHRQQEADLQENAPGLALAAEVAPAFIPGAGAARLVKGVSNVVGRTAAAGLAGGVAAGTYGFAEGEGGAKDRAVNAAYSAGAGALLGAAAPRLTDFAVSVPRRVQRAFTRSAERPTTGTLKAAKNAAYKAVDQSGEAFTPDEMSGLFSRVKTAFEDGNYVDDVDDAMRASLRILDRRQGKPTTLAQLDGIRQNLWKRYSRAQDQPQILDAIKEIDDLIDGKAGASELMGVARAANARYAKSQLFEDAFERAVDNTEAAGSGGNIANRYKQAVKSILHSPKHSRFFKDEELQMMRDFIRMDASAIQKSRRLAGKLSPNGNGLMMTLHVVGGMSTSGATLPLMAVGALAKGSADKSVTKAASEIQDYLAGVPRQSVNALSASGSNLAVGSAPVSENAQNELRNALGLVR